MTSAPPTPVADVSTGARPRRMSPTAAFWTLAATLLAFMCAAAAPSPLYSVYQDEWQFSAITLTVVFAVYAIALLAALITVGALSDHIGRRPALLAALATQAVAMIAFITADGSGWLLVARILQGLATGLATGATSACLVDLRPKLAPLINTAAPGIGLGAGALGSGLLVEYAPAPTTLVYVLLLVACAVSAVGVALMPETSPRHPGALTSLRPRIGVPGNARGRFLTVVPILVTTWSMTGFYMSLGPSLAIELLGITNHLVGGFVVCCLMGTAAIGSIVFRHRSPRAAIIAASPVLLVGLIGTLAALATASAPLFFVSTVITGFGFGGAFLGAFGSVSQLAEPNRRAALFATVYTVNYSAFSLPAVAAGVAVTQVGLSWTANAYAIIVAVVATIGLISAVRLLPKH
ncbi:MFS transporter [Saccharopolyspora sp. K220]|uniref:MFS transporter n=1 Tax=Saccharopolyspora soli TaxID=2926618 RepID=UPI001F56BFF7|nr:MFS transporter [Saccharopolyspora soli]MCI2417820.1 MFS transporter [Saccharopolyspora soli]